MAMDVDPSMARKRAEIDEILQGADHRLLRRHAPILRLDARELFRPCAVDGYVDASVLADSTGVVDPDISVGRLDDRWGSGVYLRFIDDEDRRGLLKREAPRIARRVLTSRLGRVGMFGRLLDALFQLSVWIRPCTPRLTTAAAANKAERLGLHSTRVTYGRVLRAGEWIVLHYAWFYVMNDWRTSYGGLNDHEADWEQAWVYCDPADQRPVWIAATSHEHRGSELRRRWDDPEVEARGHRPVLYAAAGSHALFFRPGDFVTRIDVPGLRWALRARAYVRRVLAIPDATTLGPGPALGVPFIDSAGGDGEMVTEAELRSLETALWVDEYRGLWGLDTGDPLQGERGPAGPKFDRRGEVRASWADPLGFAGLHGTPPPSAMAQRVNLEKLDRAIEELDARIRYRGRLLPLAHQTESANEMVGESAKMTELLRQQTELFGLRRRIERGRMRSDGIRDHLRHPAMPLPDVGRGRWFIEAWAALTIPAVLGCVGLVLLSDSLGAVKVGLVAVGLFMPLEQLVRGRLATVVRLLVLELMLFVLAVFVIGQAAQFGPVVLGVGLVLAALVLLVSNLAELWAMWFTQAHSPADPRSPASTVDSMG